MRKQKPEYLVKNPFTFLGARFNVNDGFVVQYMKENGDMFVSLKQHDENDTMKKDNLYLHKATVEQLIQQKKISKIKPLKKVKHTPLSKSK